MNFLAHLFLSSGESDIKIGNFIGDSVKGKSYLKFPESIQLGIILHRQIDHFTDNHSLVKVSKDRFRDSYGKYAGIVVDILYDHFLIINWQKYSNEPINDFIKDSYTLILRRYYILPARVKLYFPFMFINNWLAKYEFEDGIEQVLNGMSSRTSLPSNTHVAMQVFRKHYSVFNSEFQQFFPEMIDFVDNKILEIRTK